MFACCRSKAARIAIICLIVVVCWFIFVVMKTRSAVAPTADFSFFPCFESSRG